MTLEVWFKIKSLHVNCSMILPQYASIVSLGKTAAKSKYVCQTVNCSVKVVPRTDLGSYACTPVPATQLSNGCYSDKFFILQSQVLLKIIALKKI